MDQPLRGLFIPFAVLAHLATTGIAKAQSFDFYVLSLSWWTSSCATERDARRCAQCGPRQSFGLVVHGLWPQYEKGYPESCSSREPHRVPRSLGEQMFDIMPSMGLIGHQWRKHGSCTGLTQRAYLRAVRHAFERIRIPPDLTAGEERLSLSPSEIERKFTDANPGMSSRGVAVRCQRGRLEEVRICLTKDLRFRDCAEVDRGGCRLDRIELPPAD